MLHKRNRLTRADFMDCFSKGKRVHNPYSTAIVCPGAIFTCAVVVGKKVSKKAVTRNALRRRAYGVIERLQKQQSITGRYIFVLKPLAATVSRVSLQTYLEVEFGRALN